MTTMKTKLRNFAGIFLFLVFSAAYSPAQSPGAPAPQQFDPMTGMAISPAAQEWKDTNWQDPDIVLTNVVYDNFPISEIAHDIRDRFKEQFDVLLPKSGG